MMLQNKVALVTGAGSGIGRAIAQLYAREGAKVVVSDVNESGGNETVSLIKAQNGTAAFFRADVSSPEENQALVDFAVKQYGNLHVACNNAGIGGKSASTAEYDIADWQKVLTINLSSVFYGMRAQIPAMLKAGSGAIVNIASILGQVGFQGSIAYVAAKHGVVGLTQTTAMEYATQNIRVNAIGPAFIETPLLSVMDAEAHKMLVGLHPMGRLGKPEEVAELAAWLSSDRASFCTSAYYPVDGGYLAR